jgi:hypothetical protein
MNACFVVPTGRTWDGDDPDTLETRTAIIVPDPSLDI